MTLAIFDLDETLIRGDSCSLFCEFLVEQGLVGEEFIAEDRRMMDLYNSEKLVLSDYVSFFIEPLQHLTADQVDALMPGFVERFISPCIYPEAIVKLAELKAEGYRPVIVSATAEFIVKAVANTLGVSDVLAIQLEQDQDFYTGQIEGVPTFREGKVTRLQSWLVEQQESIEGAHFYSDSINDLPLLEQVDFPVATNPDGLLLVVASERNWPVLNWTAPDHNDFNQTPEQHFTRQELTHV